MATSLADKLKKIREELKTPPKLSTVEAEKITATFEAMKEILDDTLKLVLEKDRAEAFRYTNLLVTAIQQADVNFIGGVAVEPEINEENPETPKNEKTKTTQPTEKPDFLGFTQGLTPHQMNVAQRLDCFKQYEELGDDIVCLDCTQEKMIACIRMEDPTINPDDDFELDVKMIRGERNNP
jgi:hypothetical protein